MEILRVLLIVAEAIASVLLIGIILLQRAKNEGLGLAFGAQVGETLFGSRAGNVLTRITVWLAAFFVINTVVLAILYSKAGTGSSSLMEQAVGAGAANAPAAAPAKPGTAAPGGAVTAPPAPASPVVTPEQNVPVNLPVAPVPAAPAAPAAPVVPAPAPTAPAPAPAP